MPHLAVELPPSINLLPTWLRKNKTGINNSVVIHLLNNVCVNEQCETLFSFVIQLNIISQYKFTRAVCMLQQRMENKIFYFYFY